MQTINLETLRQQGLLWRGRHPAGGHRRVLPTGWAMLDSLLDGGWPCAALAEVLGRTSQGQLSLGLSLGLSLMVPLLAGVGTRQCWAVLVNPPHVPYAPALAVRGVDVSRLLLIRDVADEPALWAAEQALKSGACGVVLAWPGPVQVAQLRRLQLAAEQGDCLGVLFRPRRAAVTASPAVLRLRVDPVPLGLEVEVLKRRGSWHGGRCIVPLEPPNPRRLRPDPSALGPRP
jgi:cell division inhibitor SulA/protein ImuA